MNTKIKTQHVFWLILVSLLWAGTFLFVKIADREIDPITVMAGRGIFSFLFMVLAIKVLGKPALLKSFKFNIQLPCFVAGSLMAYMWYSLSASETVLTASMTALLMTSLAVWSWLINVFITKLRHFSWLNLFGIVLAVSGIVIMLGIHNILHFDHHILYALFYLSGTLTFACSATVSKIYCSPKVDAFTSTTYILFYGTLILTTLSLCQGHVLHAHYSLTAILAVLGVGILSTGVGYLIFFWLASEAGPVFACYNAYLTPIFGFLLGVYLLKEPLLRQQVLGIAIVLLGVYCADKQTH